MSDAHGTAPEQGASQEPAPERPRLKLKPRDPAAAAKAEAERQASLSKSAGLFGSARPREAVIANREGRTEEEVLRAEALERYRLQLRLSPQQAEEKRAATEALSTAQTLLSEAQDSENPPSAEALTALAADRDVAQAALDELM
ncbi:hypothetical protein H632_c22p4, partial [Helicosporidium sp. ATCC 50920]